MGNIHMGCQAYTWQMSYDKYSGRLPHILDMVNEAGFTGFEAEVCMMGSYYRNPDLLAFELEKRKLRFGAICLALHWKYNMETDDEKYEAEKVLDYIKHFPDVVLVLCQMPGNDRSDLYERQKNAISCLNTIASRASEKGIVSVFHPNSPKGSVFRTEEDYKVLIDGIDSRFLGFAPDSGHIANGGMDVLSIFKAYRSLIKHVHFKDISTDGKWALMGNGVTDFPAIVSFLDETGYNGWIMIEDESFQAESDPDAATIWNGRYVKNNIKGFNI
jgi:inosose dehydratase